MKCTYSDDEIHHHVVSLVPFARVFVERPDGTCTAIVLIDEPTPYKMIANLVEILCPDDVEVSAVVLTEGARAEIFLRLRVTWETEEEEKPSEANADGAACES